MILPHNPDMLAWHLGLRYLRTRRAAWLALSAITLTVAVPIVVLGVIQGFIDVTRIQVRANESDLTCEPPYYTYGISDTPQQRRNITDIPGVAGIAPFVSTYAMLTRLGSNDRLSIPCQVDAVDWSADAKLKRISADQLHPAPELDLHHPPIPPEERGTGFLTPDWRAHLSLLGADLVCGLGPVPLPPRQRPMTGVVVGRELAFGNGLMPGMRMKFLGYNGQTSAQISDTLGTGIYEIDRLNVLMPLPVGQVLADMRKKDQQLVNGYRVKINPDADLETMRRQVGNETQLRTTTWFDRRANFVRSLEQQRRLMGVVMICIQAITIFIVYAVFSTLVAEKRHDLGVLLGIGATSGTITRAFIIASLAACLFGGALGWLLGWALLWALNPISIFFNVPLFPQDVFYAADTPISWNPLIPVFFMGTMTVVGFVAAALPAWRAGRIDPVEILREGS
jgi:ABC-type lipoprotein release transport system permease subunit